MCARSTDWMPFATASTTASSDGVAPRLKVVAVATTRCSRSSCTSAPRKRPYARSFATPLLRRTPSQPPVSIGSRNTTIPAFAASRMIASARAKYAGFGVERSPGVVKGLMPSNVVPSSLQPVYFAHRRSTQSALNPAALRSRDVGGGVVDAQVPDHRLRRVADDHERHVALIDEVTPIARELEREDESVCRRRMNEVGFGRRRDARTALAVARDDAVGAPTAKHATATNADARSSSLSTFAAVTSSGETSIRCEVAAAVDRSVASHSRQQAKGGQLA